MGSEYWGGLLPTYTGSRFLVERSIILEVVKCRMGHQGFSHILIVACKRGFPFASTLLTYKRLGTSALCPNTAKRNWLLHKQEYLVALLVTHLRNNLSDGLATVANWVLQALLVNYFNRAHI